MNQITLIVKFTLEQAMKSQRRSRCMAVSTLSLTSALVGGVWLTSRPGCLTPWKCLAFRCTEGWVGHRPGRTGARNLAPSGFLFIFSCTLCVIHPYLLLCLDCPVICLLSLLITHNTTHTSPRRNSNPQSQQASGHRPAP